MAEIVKNTTVIASAFIIYGIAFIRDTTTNLRPSFLEIRRNGRSILSNRMTLIKGMFMLFSSIDINYTI